MDKINEVYSREYCFALEQAYGAGLMSEGGMHEIDKIFAGMHLEGKQLLDFGSGLGQHDIYLAAKHRAHVTGVDVNPAMVEQAASLIPEHLRGRVKFVRNESSYTLPFSDQSFDVLFSKAVIVHLDDAQHESMFQEFHRVLKPGGQVVIVDWLSPTDGQWSPHIMALVENENLPLHAYTLQRYLKLFADHGLVLTRHVDRSDDYAQYNLDIVNRLNEPDVRMDFQRRMGSEVWQTHVSDYQQVANALPDKAAMVFAFYANRPLSPIKAAPQLSEQLA